MKRIHVLHFLVLIFLASCGSGTKKKSVEEVMAELDSINTTSEVPVVDQSKINDIIQSIPSPLEISFLIKETGGGYHKSYLNPTSNKSNYNTSYAKALNLGIFGADLAYSNIYNKSQDGIFYLDAVTEMADDLNIGQYFETSMLRRLIKNNNDLDSLLLITTSNFEKINSYLQEQNRSQLSILILVGGWVEGINLLNEVNKLNSHPELKERIGEQKIVLEQFVEMLSYYKYDNNIKALYDDLSRLNDVYKDIKIEIIEGEVTFEEVDGIMMVVDNSKSEISITEDQVKQIFNITKEIRNGIISNE